MISSRPEQQERAEDIAIVGMSCLFPGADSPARFWQNVVDKFDAIGDAPPDWQPELFYDPAGPAVDRSYTRRGGFLGDLCRFHPPKYGVPPSAVEGAEPDHFIALKCAYQAVADAGYPTLPLNRPKTGVILGRGLFVNRGWVAVFQRTVAVDQVLKVLGTLEPHRSQADLDTIRRELKKNLPPANTDTFPGLVHSALVGRIANRLDLQGPAYTVDAACSSTLLAVEHGIRELQAGRCDAMLVGGAQVSTPAPIHIMFCHLQALSREGKIAPFSAEAEGTVLGQGCGILVLKRRSDAERDGNRIYALLKSAGISSDGKGAGLLAPRTEGQQLSIARAYLEAGISPDTIGLVEAHGTGIPLGDAVELHSLQTCFGPRRGEHADVAIGSVKSMVGHLVPASGAVSLIKTALALHHRVLPPTLHAETPNPALELDKSRFYLCTEPRPWIHGNPQVPRRAGVNAFGFGGINAHVILEEYNGASSDHQDLERDWPCELVVVSATDRVELARRVAQLSSWLKQSTGCTLLDVAASCTGWQGNCRLAIVATSLEDLLKKLDRAAPLLADPQRQRIQDRGGVYWYAQPLAREGRVALVFPGEGSQYANMLGQLCRHFPVVRREFDLTSRAFETRGTSLSRVLFPQPATTKQVESELFEMDTAVAAVTAAARGLWRLLNVLQVKADAVVGHSSGEYAALLAAGAYRHQDDDAMVHAILAGIDSAVELKTANVLPQCSLVSVGGVPEATLDEVLAEFRQDVTVAMDNCPHQKILVGSKPVMSQVLLRLQGKGGLCQPLAWDRPYHTEAFAPACSIVQRYFDSLELCPPEIELWSCATAAPMPLQSDAVRELAVRQWRSPVRFRETIDAMYAAGVRVFIECGPRGNLSTFVADTLGDRPHAAVPLDVPNKSGIEQLCRAMGSLAAHGVALDLAALYARRNPQMFDFDGPPAKAPPQEPVLPLELPMLEMDRAVVEHWRAGATSPAKVERHTHVGSNGNGHHPATDGNGRTTPTGGEPGSGAMHGGRSTGNGHGPAPSQRSIARAAVAEHVSPGVSAAAAHSLIGTVHEEFQRTMQQFLRAQATVGALWGAPLQAPASDLLLNDAAPPEDSPMFFQRSVSPPSTPSIAQAASAFSLSSDVGTLDRPESPSLQTAPRQWPFVESLLEFRPGQRVVFECELTPEKHPFLRDHTFFGRRISDAHPELTPLAVMPLAMSMELLAEAAATLCPEQSVVALSDIRMSRWLAFAGDSRRVRVIAQCLNDQWVEARLVEADGDGEHEILSAQVELGNLPNTLGPRRLPALTFGPPPWPREALYQKILYHGPAFQGIEHVEAWGPSGISAQVREPSQRLLPKADAELVLPVALIDTASQIPGLVNGDLDSAGACCTMAFPNVIERLEFGRAIFDGAAMAAVSTLEQLPGKLRSDTEFARPDGQVVLRYWNKIEETIEFPLPLYRYALNPHTAFRERSLNALFDGVPLIDKLAVCQATAAGERLWAKAMWARVLAYQIFGTAERAEFNRLKLPPVALADWLLGRLAAKEAVRARLAHGGCLADTEIRKDEFQRPRAFIAGREAALVSLAHKTFQAVAVCGLASDFQGLGIDCEPLDALSPEVVADAFDDHERQLLDFPNGLRAGWGAKEAVAKALGRGVLGGPRCLAIESADPNSQTLTVSLRGAMAQAFPQYRQGEPVTLTAYWREHDNQIIVLSYIPNP